MSPKPRCRIPAHGNKSKRPALARDRHIKNRHVIIASVGDKECVFVWSTPKKTRQGKTIGDATLTFFNAPFDISRLAYSYGEGRLHNKGAFTFEWFPRWTDRETGEEKPNRYRPRIAVNAIDSNKSMIHYMGVAKDTATGRPAEIGRGHFLDLKQLIWGMTNESTSLARAGAATSSTIQRTKAAC